MLTPFSGSYSAEDVHFLLKPMHIGHTPIQTKEKLIQSGVKPYYEMLTHEAPPSDDYLELFQQAILISQDRVARHLVQLAEQIVATRNHGITLVSLARAGTPFGVILKHILNKYYRMRAHHYSISILKTVGIDKNALRFILSHHSPESLVFIDGWTGKGVIARQLAISLAEFQNSDGVSIPAELYVLADLCGAAEVSVCSEDYLIPSCLLNATVSGLVSRTIWKQQDRHSNDDFHGCVYYRQLERHDRSRYFIDTIMARVDNLWPLQKKPDSQAPFASDRRQLQIFATENIKWLSQQYKVSRQDLIKPGIGESTRVLLRREASLLLLRNLQDPETMHLRRLAEEKSVAIEVSQNLPYRAVALIKEISA